MSISVNFPQVLRD